MRIMCSTAPRNDCGCFARRPTSRIVTHSRRSARRSGVFEFLSGCSGGAGGRVSRRRRLASPGFEGFAANGQPGRPAEQGQGVLPRILSGFHNFLFGFRPPGRPVAACALTCVAGGLILRRSGQRGSRGRRPGSPAGASCGLPTGSPARRCSSSRPGAPRFEPPEGPAGSDSGEFLVFDFFRIVLRLPGRVRPDRTRASACNRPHRTRPSTIPTRCRACRTVRMHSVDNCRLGRSCPATGPCSSVP